jgi:hypothetical protein
LPRGMGPGVRRDDSGIMQKSPGNRPGLFRDENLP